jgi:hypothetical protein
MASNLTERLFQLRPYVKTDQQLLSVSRDISR